MGYGACTHTCLLHAYIHMFTVYTYIYIYVYLYVYIELGLLRYYFSGCFYPPVPWLKLLQPPSFLGAPSVSLLDNGEDPCDDGDNHWGYGQSNINGLEFASQHMGVSETGGTHNGWLVCFMEDPNLKSMRTTVGGRNPAPPL